MIEALSHNLKILNPQALSGNYAPFSITSLEAQFKTWCLKINETIWTMNSLRSVKDGLGQSKFEFFSKCMTNLTVLPHSSACNERIFSQVNSVEDFKNKLFESQDYPKRNSR